MKRTLYKSEKTHILRSTLNISLNFKIISIDFIYHLYQKKKKIKFYVLVKKIQIPYGNRNGK